MSNKKPTMTDKVLYDHNRPFFCIDRFFRPSSDPTIRVRTEQRGWGKEPRNWEISELPYAVDRISPSIMRRATIIIDLLDGKLRKNRFTGSKEGEILDHYMKKYAETINEARGIWNMRNRASETAAV